MNYKQIVILLYTIILTISLPTITMQERKEKRALLLQQRLQQNNTTGLLKINNNDLIVACYTGDIKKVTHLIKAGANPNYQIKTDDIITTPLIIACTHGHSEISTILIDHNADMFIQSSKLNPWLIACTNGHNSICKKMIEKDPSIIKSRTLSQQCGLHLAVNYNNRELIQMIAEADTEKQVLNAFAHNYTPLGIACSKNFLDSAKILLKNGANPNIFHQTTVPLLHLAVYKQNYKMVKYLIKYKVDINIAGGITRKDSALYYAALTGNARIGKLLIDNNAIINEHSTTHSPLFYAIGCKKYDFLKMLLDTGIRTDQHLLLFFLIALVDDEKITNLFKSYDITVPSPEETKIQKNTFFEEVNADSSSDTMQPIAETHPIQVEPILADPHAHVIQQEPIKNTQKNIPKKNLAVPQKKRALSPNQPCSQEDNKYLILAAKNIKWPKGLSKNLLQKIKDSLAELAYYSPGKTLSNVTSLKGFDHTYRIRIEDIRVIFSFDHTQRKIYILDIGLRKNIYKRFTTPNNPLL